MLVLLARMHTEGEEEEEKEERKEDFSDVAGCSRTGELHRGGRVGSSNPVAGGGGGGRGSGGGGGDGGGGGGGSSNRRRRRIPPNQTLAERGVKQEQNVLLHISMLA